MSAAEETGISALVATGLTLTTSMVIEWIRSRYELAKQRAQTDSEEQSEEIAELREENLVLTARVEELQAQAATQRVAIARLEEQVAANGRMFAAIAEAADDETLRRVLITMNPERGDQ